MEDIGLTQASSFQDPLRRTYAKVRKKKRKPVVLGVEEGEDGEERESGLRLGLMDEGSEEEDGGRQPMEEEEEGKDIVDVEEEEEEEEEEGEAPDPSDTAAFVR